jgi:hypothetical protein
VVEVPVVPVVDSPPEVLPVLEVEVPVVVPPDVLVEVDVPVVVPPDVLVEVDVPVVVPPDVVVEVEDVPDVFVLQLR